MHYHVGLDISLELTAVCVVDEAGTIIMERTVASTPDDISRCLAGYDGKISRIGFESGP